MGLLQPIPPPTRVWEDISLDFIVGLPPFVGHTIILVIMDHFSKATHFGILPSHATAYKTMELFTSIYCRHHGFPHSIIFDRDPIFLSGFWKELFCLQWTKLRMSTSYHPQSDGQTEVINQSSSSTYELLCITSQNSGENSSIRQNGATIPYYILPPVLPHSK